jgi:site-specific DNA-methyltransferase (adenine-specific)
LPTFGAGTFDAIVTDPPFGILKSEAWDTAIPSVEFWRAAFRALKPGGKLVMISDDRVCHRMAVAIEDAGFEIEGHDAWIFADGRPRAATQPRPAFTPIIVARTPGPALLASIDEARIPWRDDRDRLRARRAKTLQKAQRRNTRDSSDRPTAYEPHPAGRWPSNVLADDGALGHQQHVFQLPRVRDPQGHPCAKPVELMAHLIRLYAPASGVVLDPFGGAGTTGAAARITGRRCVLVERETRFIAMAEARLGAIHAAFPSAPHSIDVEETGGDTLVGLGAARHAPGPLQPQPFRPKSSGFMVRAMRDENELRQPDERATVMTPRRALTATELATALKVSVRSIRRWVAANKIPFMRAGRILRFDLERVRAALAAQGGIDGALLRQEERLVGRPEPAQDARREARPRLQTDQGREGRESRRSKGPGRQDESRAGRREEAPAGDHRPGRQAAGGSRDAGARPDHRDEAERLRSAADLARLLRPSGRGPFEGDL